MTSEQGWEGAAVQHEMRGMQPAEITGTGGPASADAARNERGNETGGAGRQWGVGSVGVSRLSTESMMVQVKGRSASDSKVGSSCRELSAEAAAAANISSKPGRAPMAPAQQQASACRASPRRTCRQRRGQA